MPAHAATTFHPPLSLFLLPSNRHKHSHKHTHVSTNGKKAHGRRRHYYRMHTKPFPLYSYCSKQQVPPYLQRYDAMYYAPLRTASIHNTIDK